MPGEQKLYQQGTLSLDPIRDYIKLVPAVKDGKIVDRLQIEPAPLEVKK